MRAGMIDMEANVTLVQNFPAHEAVPDGAGPFPAVVVFHDRFGLTPHVRSVANRLAREGLYALAPNFFAMTSSFSPLAPAFLKPTRVGYFEYEDGPAAQERSATLTDQRAAAIFGQASRFLATRSPVRPGGIGALGFSMGGRLAFLAACIEPDVVRACASFYPRGLGSAAGLSPGQADPLERAADLRAALLLFYGRLDDTIRPEERENVRSRLVALGKDFAIETFPEAGHDFFCPDRPESYRIRASKTAWERTLALFRSRLPGA
jgi:dienelactone hydrolase